MSALTKLTVTEAKLFARDPVSLFFGLAFPALLLFALGMFMPGFRDPNPDLNGGRLVDLYAPIVLGFALVSAGVGTLSAYLAAYREQGVLRRLGVTPVHPSRLLLALIVVQVVTAIVAGGLAIGVGALVFDIEIPQNAAGFVLAFVLAATAMFAIGLLVGAIAPSASAGQGLGMVVYFPLLFFAGVWFPRAAMSDTLRTVSDFTPAGAGVQALQDTWFGAAPAASNLAVMAAYAIVTGLLATRLFRWE